MGDIKKREAIKQSLSSFGGEWVDLPIFLPSETVLELAGESLRPRLYFATAPDGREICLRADLTIPASLHFIENFGLHTGAKTYLCSGKVFRANAESDYKAHEFRQMGIEHFGDCDVIKSDVELFIAIDNACKVNQLGEFEYEFFDGGLIRKIIGDSKIDPIWRDYLNDCAQDGDELRNSLKNAQNGDFARVSHLAKSLANMNINDAAATIEEVLEIAKLKTHGSRGPKEIALRIQQKAKRATIAPISATYASIFQEILAINENIETAVDKIFELCGKIEVDLSQWRAQWRSRLDLIDAKNGNIIAKSTFKGDKFGRFEYYDGFAFDIFSAKSPRPVASGGRYDGLIFELSNGALNTPAVGGVIRPEILLEA